MKEYLIKIVNLIKSIFLRIVKLVHLPLEEWVHITQDYQNVSSVRKNFFFPCIMLVLSLTFINALFKWSDLVFSEFLRDTLVRFSSLFAGVYFSVLLLNEVLRIKWVAGEASDKDNFYGCFTLTVFSSSIMWCMDMIQMFIPPLFFLAVLNIYVAYVIWCGLPILFRQLGDNHKGLLTLIAFVLMFLIPRAVGYVMLRIIE